MAGWLLRGRDGKEILVPEDRAKVVQERDDAEEANRALIVVLKRIVCARGGPRPVHELRYICRFHSPVSTELSPQYTRLR